MADDNEAFVSNKSHDGDANQPSDVVVCYHPNGQMCERIEFDDGVADGLWQKWDSRGQLVSECEWKGGRQHGRQTQWFKNGTRSSEIHWADGKSMDPRVYGQRMVPR